MGVSGLKKDMSAGRVTPGTYKMDNAQWSEKTSKAGNDNVNLSIDFIDTGGTAHHLDLWAGKQEYVRVKKGKLVSVGARDFQLSSGMGAGQFLGSLDEAGFSAKKLNNIGDAPGALNGQWVVVESVPDGTTDPKGNPNSNPLVSELLDGPPKGAKAGKASKVSKKEEEGDEDADEEDEDEDEEEGDDDAEDEDEDEDADGDDDESDDDDEESSDDDDAPPSPLKNASKSDIATAVEFTQQLVANAPEWVKNYDADAGISLRQANAAVFTKLKGKGVLKGVVGSLVSNAGFHEKYADEGGWVFDSEVGVIRPKKAKGKKQKK